VESAHGITILKLLEILEGEAIAKEVAKKIVFA